VHVLPISKVPIAKYISEVNTFMFLSLRLFFINT